MCEALPPTLKKKERLVMNKRVHHYPRIFEADVGSFFVMVSSMVPNPSGLEPA